MWGVYRYFFFSFRKKRRCELSVGQQEQVIGLVNVELYQSNSSFSTLGFERIEWVNQPNKLKVNILFYKL